MFKNRFVLILAALLMLLVTLAVSRPFSKPPKTVDLSLPPRPVIVPVTGVEDQPYVMDSATQSYIAWGEALEAAGKLGEGSAIPTVDLRAYYISERTLVDPNAGLAIYQLSERTLIDPQAGMVIYQNSERNQIPFRNLDSFNPYQRSEWFGNMNLEEAQPDVLDSATRSYIAWGLALQAKNDLHACH